MPTYKYTARDQEGKNVSGRISAENESVIVAELRKRNLIILSISEEKESAFKKSVQAQGREKSQAGRPGYFYPPVCHHGGCGYTHFAILGSAE